MDLTFQGVIRILATKQFLPKGEEVPVDMVALAVDNPNSTSIFDTVIPLKMRMDIYQKIENPQSFVGKLCQLKAELSVFMYKPEIRVIDIKIIR
jgi:hypothetical protein